MNGGPPVAALHAIQRALLQVVGPDIPLFAVGLDARGELNPLVASPRVVGEGAEEVDEVVGLFGGRSDPERGAPGVDLAAEILPVGEGVGVLFEPRITALLGGFQFGPPVVEVIEEAAVVSAGSREPSGAGVLFDGR
jgi:hypothetical protein